MHVKGGNISIRLGNTLMNPTDVAENVYNGLQYAGDTCLLVCCTSRVY
jgi:hypothetical protein